MLSVENEKNVCRGYISRPYAGISTPGGCVSENRHPMSEKLASPLTAPPPLRLNQSRVERKPEKEKYICI